VLDVSSDFINGDDITVSGLGFASFTAVSAADNLELEVNNDDVVSATDSQTITIIDAYGISSAANQGFAMGDADTLISSITITEDAVTPTITAANDLRIRIPAGFNMSWDTTDTTATLGGAAAGKVSTTVSYEDAGMTLVVDVTSDFSVGDQLTVADLQFSNFTLASLADNLELEVNNDDAVSATDDKTITISGPAVPLIYSVIDQAFNVNDAATATSAITVIDSATPTITALNDLRIRIPASFNMSWDTSDTTATIGGTASGKVSTTVSYEDAGKTLVLDVSSDFINGDQITVADLSFSSFTAVSAADNLELGPTRALPWAMPIPSSAPSRSPRMR